MSPTQRQILRERHQKARKRRQVIGFSILGGFALLILVIVIISIINNKADKDALAATEPASETVMTEAAPTQDVPRIPVTPMSWDSPPAMTIDVTKEYYATVKLVKGGEFVIQLYPDKAPITVNNFVFLSREGFYNGVTFHRVLEGFMAQGGDQDGDGMGGPGYQFVNEVSDLQFDKAGVVAMANAGRDTNGSQFFIMFGTGSLSPADYTIFGQVIEGMDVVNGITRRDPDDNPAFEGDQIESITIEEK